MKALILNSGTGSRMGEATKVHPKCMTEIAPGETILSRQLRQLAQAGVEEAVITTGLFADVLEAYARGLDTGLRLIFIHNPIFRDTNYIYSIDLAAGLLQDDIVLMHGDLVFDAEVLRDLLKCGESCMAVSSTVPLPEKDFKAVIRDRRIEKIGVEFFDRALAAQPLYYLYQKDWMVWLHEISAFCLAGKTDCYAENAFNEVSAICKIVPLDVQYNLCNEIDTVEDLNAIKERLKESGR